MARPPTMRSIAFRESIGPLISTGTGSNWAFPSATARGLCASSRRGGHFRVHLESDGRAITETTRKVILANGFGGNGGPYVPDVLSRDLPKELYAHTSERIDFEALRGKSVAVLGSAASAFDAAAVALENGAREVHLFARRKTLAALPVIRLRLYPGAYDNYGSLPDALRWQQAVRFRREGSTPPADSISRATQFS